MTARTLEAVYEHGVFRPVVKPAGIAEGQHVRLTVESGSPEDILALAASVYEGLTDEEIDDVEKIAFARDDFFGERTTESP
jgi:predicted DNA-binding antitoxin AbrB/MazE fold protein